MAAGRAQLRHPNCRFRVAVRVAIRHGAAPPRKGRPVALAQPEQIRTTASRAANPVDRTAQKYSNIPSQPPTSTTGSRLDWLG